MEISCRSATGSGVLVAVGRGVLVVVEVIIGGRVALIVAVGEMLVILVAGTSVGVGEQAEKAIGIVSRKKNDFNFFI